MLVRNILAALCLYWAGVCNGMMDATQFHYSKTVFADKTRHSQQFWDPSISWKNKYRNLDPKQGEAFPLASTALVFLTDGWHLFKFGMLKGFILAVVLMLPFSAYLGHERWQVWGGNALLFLIGHAAFNLGFHTSYV